MKGLVAALIGLGQFAAASSSAAAFDESAVRAKAVACRDARDWPCAADTLVTLLSDPGVRDRCKHDDADRCGWELIAFSESAYRAMMAASPDQVLILFDRYHPFAAGWPGAGNAADQVATLHLLRAEACEVLGRDECVSESANRVKVSLDGGEWPYPMDEEFVPNLSARAQALVAKAGE